MGNVFDIEGYTGPGRRTRLFASDVEEIGFNFKKKILSVVTRDGNYGSYDMVPMTEFEFDSDGTSYVIVVKTKAEFEKEEETKKNKEAKEKELQAKEKELIDKHNKEVEEIRDNDRKQTTDGSTQGAGYAAPSNASGVQAAKTTAQGTRK